MGPAYKIARKNHRSKSATKQTIKYLAVCQDPNIRRIILKSASDSVYKSICNAFFNVAENPEFVLGRGQRKLLKKHNPLIHQLVARDIPIKKKRHLIQKGGGIFLAAVLPAVLSTAISLLGSAFTKKD